MGMTKNPTPPDTRADGNYLYMPTEEEIKAQAEEIRKTWKPKKLKLQERVNGVQYEPVKEVHYPKGLGAT